MTVQIEGTPVSLSSQQIIGTGGEADVYDIGGGEVLKLFKQPDHPDYDNQPNQQTAARKRLDEHQKKLPQFPQSVPDELVAPQRLAQDQDGRIVGYTMRHIQDADLLVKYADKTFRAGTDEADVTALFRQLHQVVAKLHDADIVIGDFNDLNVMVKNTTPFLIDADSYQFNGFLCRVFTQQFADPRKLQPAGRSRQQWNTDGELTLQKPHDRLSDWYAFTVLLMQSLLFVGPYGGVYRPPGNGKQLTRSERILDRVTVFAEDVTHPQPARDPDILPHDLLDYFVAVFAEDERNPFPSDLLNELHWRTCSQCGLTHARSMCPQCKQAADGQTTQKVTGDIEAERLFQTPGRIVFADYQDKQLHWLYHKNGRFYREGDIPVAKADLSPQTVYRISGDTTLFGTSNEVSIVSGDGSRERISTDHFGDRPIFDATADDVLWVEQGKLLRATDLGTNYTETIGSVLKNRTLFWAGQETGFGFYRAGKIQRYFVFNPQYRGVKEDVDIAPVSGQLLQAQTFFARNRIWFFQTIDVQGRRVNRCHLLRDHGVLIGRAETAVGDGSWLGTIDGKLAVGDFLLAATDDGVVRVEPSGNSLTPVKQFSGTSHVANAASHLFVGNDGITVVNRHSIWNLTIS
jgi:H/ACA ribonucleoprotein complex subunit 3